MTYQSLAVRLRRDRDMDSTMRRETIRLAYRDDARLDSYAWPGGYQIIYLTREMDTLCAACAAQEIRDWAHGEYSMTDRAPVVAQSGYPEGPSDYCAGCNRIIYSDCGDPDELEEPCAECGAMIRPYSEQHTEADCQSHLAYLDKRALDTAESGYYAWRWDRIIAMPRTEAGYLARSIAV